jgi:hypothetical protein
MGVQVDPAVSNNKRSSTLSFENLGEQSSSDESTTINSTKSLASYADSVPSVGSVLSSDSIPSTDSVQYHCRNPYVIRLGFKTVCALALLPPMGALIVVFAVGVVFDFSELFNYDWNNCGV